MLGLEQWSTDRAARLEHDAAAQQGLHADKVNYKHNLEHKSEFYPTSHPILFSKGPKPQQTHIISKLKCSSSAQNLIS